MADEKNTEGKGKAVAMSDAPEEQEEVQASDPAQVADILKVLNLTQRLPGAVSAESLMESSANDKRKIVSGKQQKDMSKYQFWGTQPVPNFGEPRVFHGSGGLITRGTEEAKTKIEPDQEGPIKNVADVRKTPLHLPTGFEWCTLDLSSEEEASHRAVHGIVLIVYRSKRSFPCWNGITSRMMARISVSGTQKPS